MGRPRLAALVLALAAGCTPAVPSAAPEAVVAPWNDIIVPGNAITVTTDTLDVRVDASAAADSVGSIARGDVAVVQSFPVVVEDAIWYYVKKVPTEEPGRLPELPAQVTYEDYALVGWVAASGGAGPNIARTALRCPIVADFDNVSAMLGGERLACFGSAPITIEGTFGCEGCSGGELGFHGPAWLAGHGGGSLVDETDPDRRGVSLFFPPGAAAPANAAFVRLTGHFDSPVARTCVMDPAVMLGDDAGLLPAPAFAAIAVELCRQRFVVESWEVLGAEEIPPPD